ncbi:hypothetical protein QFZ31_006671 [Neobacillus niacini]|uniref:XkdW family protein n=1 Tax=Neobacillus driksii TaxID=3035913 RepID=UPI00277F4052|nr:XkdW family protein [Neobacillus niacini]MDQ0976619.1 hypothetical protein [Neobacillus niacini]
MNIAQAIMTLYTDAIPMENFVVRDDSDGRGQYIDEWHLPYPQPTTIELEQSWFKFLKDAKLSELKVECEKAILNGFTSPNGNSYQFDYKDQDNLTQQMLFLISDPSITTIQWKTKEGVKSHTRDEFLAVCKDADGFKRTQFGKFWALENKVTLALSEEEINAITW